MYKPVRAQVTSSQGTSTTDFKNYDFSDIPDSTVCLTCGRTDYNFRHAVRSADEFALRSPHQPAIALDNCLIDKIKGGH